MCFSLDISFTGRSLCYRVYRHRSHKYFCKHPMAGGVFVYNKYDPRSEQIDLGAFLGVGAGNSCLLHCQHKYLREENSFSLELWSLSAFTLPMSKSHYNLIVFLVG